MQPATAYSCQLPCPDKTEQKKNGSARQPAAGESCTGRRSHLISRYSTVNSLEQREQGMAHGAASGERVLPGRLQLRAHVNAMRCHRLAVTVSGGVARVRVRPGQPGRAHRTHARMDGWTLTRPPPGHGGQWATRIPAPDPARQRRCATDGDGRRRRPQWTTMKPSRSSAHFFAVVLVCV